ncbi:MAG: hypothetical protein ACYDBZ_17090 [Steroidobacteraceae bacterium]
MRVFADPFALTEQVRIEGSEQRWQTLGILDGYLLRSARQTCSGVCSKFLIACVTGASFMEVRIQISGLLPGGADASAARNVSIDDGLTGHRSCI